jgi:alpha-L-rhamnosidase
VKAGKSIFNISLSLIFAALISSAVKARPLTSEAAASNPQYGILLGPAKNRFAAIPEPYPALNGGSFIDPRVPESLDPLIAYRWETTSASDGLQIYSLRPIEATTDSPASFDNLSSLATDSPMVTVRGLGSIRVDFGVESAAWLELESDDLAGAVEMSISEYNQPAVLNIGPENPVKRKAPVKYGNVYRLELNRDLYEGVRFGWVHVVSFAQAWHIKGLRLVCQVKPTNHNGSFRCSDTALTRIWYTGAYVVKLNLLKDYFGVILMDRGDRHSWTGDAHLSQAASMAAFGNFDFVRANIERTANDDNGIGSYSLYWILSLVDYYMFTGDGTTLAKHIATVERKLDRAAAIYDSATANLGFYGWDERLGAGFENPNISENRRAYRMLFIRACREFSRAMDFAGNAALRDRYAGMAAAKAAALRADAQWYKSFGLHSLADALNAGIADAAEKASIFRQAFFDPRERWSYSPFNQYFVIRALSEMGRDDAAIETAKDYWGGQMDYGGTTFFEVYRPDWNQELKLNDPVPNTQCGYTSLAHPWGAGVARWLSDTVLGVRPTKPGFETFDILPHPGSRLSSVAGKVPTPRGTIEAAFDLTSGICSVTVPGGTSGRVGIPKAGRTVSGISVNGSVVWNGQYVQVAGIGGAGEDDEFVYLASVQPGTYSLLVTYGGSPAPTVEAVNPYAAEFLGVDGSTRGNWRGVYGKDGYVLCNYYGRGTSAMSLPIYFRSVTFGKNGALQWITGTADERALEPPPDGGAGGGERTAAAVMTQDPLPTYQTMTVDIQTDPASTAVFRIGLYFVDWDNAGRTLAVEMFDGESRSLISPLKLVKDFAGGKYLIYRYHKSCRIRINQVRGTNAVLSGIFFDSDPRESLLRLSRTSVAFGWADIASNSPGLANSYGAVGVYAMDKTKMADGVHTVAAGRFLYLTIIGKNQIMFS